MEPSNVVIVASAFVAACRRHSVAWMCRGASSTDALSVESRPSSTSLTETKPHVTFIAPNTNATAAATNRGRSVRVDVYVWQCPSILPFCVCVCVCVWRFLQGE
ncbi:hypothetical protein DQ04_11781040 [Trypanosoma grayi]|uniref:hypothetical protein n=1 Tax=Trypanosoma grayi TaxID=71804 RepID=UPI0004F47834|nr:hypothetical protein DQ04_11781040 [Trypanosoma grayi]KEG06887.1 hypothetical protein DQ04_11781040 [Trypanosoma grayi]